MYGLELDNSWWTSDYSKTFIKLNYIKQITENCLNETINCSINDNFALLFCYFNNGVAFTEYVKVFNGNFLILIGPKEGCGIVTDPLPLNPKFERNDVWCIENVIEIENSVNVIVIYKRN